MSVINQVRIFLSGMLVAVLCAHAGAQVWQPFGPVDYTHDFQPFKTFEVRNFTDRPDFHEGYFFNFDKLGWAFSGERNLIGDPNATARSIDLYPEPSLVAPNPTPIVNAIMSGLPDATLALGERYEFGYIVGHHGWNVTVLDGPEYIDVQTHGFGGDNPATPDLEGTENGLGSVAILFRADPDLLLGWLDYFQNDSIDLGVLRGPNSTVGTTVADDVNANTANGPGDPSVPVSTDFGDLVPFLTSWQTVRVKSQAQTDGVSLMKMYRFKPNHRGGVVEFYYGARYLRLRDLFRVDANGGTFGESFWDTQVDNQIFGPQVALKWMNQRGRWNMSMQGRFLFGVNIQNLEQFGAFGESLVPGRLNRPLFFNPTAFVNGKQEQDFAPVVEFRVDTSYHLTRSVALKLGYTATYIDNIRRASQQVDYVLPKMGLLSNGQKQDIFINGVNFGIELNH